MSSDIIQLLEHLTFLTHIKLLIEYRLIKTDTPKAWQQIEITLDSHQLNRACKELKHAVFLDSNTHKHNKNRYDIFSAEPISIANLATNNIKSWLDHTNQHESPFHTQKDNKTFTRSIESLPFTYGVIGFCSYNIGENSQLKNKRESTHTIKQIKETQGFPESFIGFYTWSYIFSHADQKGFLTFSPLCNSLTREKILTCINSNNHQPSPETTPNLPSLAWFKNQSFKEYAESFKSIQDYILEGDCYQVNLTQRFEAKSSTDAADLYFETRKDIHTPYSCFFSFSDKHALLSFSPEQFISINNRIIESKPIKGTIKNDGSVQNKVKLQNSEKNRAENVMIVDLIRNDLGKVCKPHSVHVPELFKVESYKNVHHLVSRISGQLKDDIDELEAFLSCFPGGSITGAPKIRSMEIIQELEQHARSAYCGSVFYRNYNGQFDSNILIRSVVKDEDTLFCWAGGGIVADSELEDEYQESLIKVNNIINLKDRSK